MWQAHDGWRFLHIPETLKSLASTLGSSNPAHFIADFMSAERYDVVHPQSLHFDTYLASTMDLFEISGIVRIPTDAIEQISDQDNILDGCSVCRNRGGQEIYQAEVSRLGESVGKVEMEVGLPMAGQCLVVTDLERMIRDLINIHGISLCLMLNLQLFVHNFTELYEMVVTIG